MVWHLMISNKEIKNIMQILITLEGSIFLLRGTYELSKEEVKKQKGGILSMVLGALGSDLLVNLFFGKIILPAGEGVVRAAENFEYRLIL